MKALVVAALTSGAVLTLPQRQAVVALTHKGKTPKAKSSGAADVDSECLAVLDGLVTLLRAGTPTTTAVAMATADFREGQRFTAPGWMRLSRAAAAGGEVGEVWTELAHEWECQTCADVAAAWRMSSRHGCPLADALETAAAGIRAARRHQGVIETAVAGANATITVLAMLPLLGVALGAALGADLFATYSGWSGFATLWPGLALMWVGRRWARALTQRALTTSAGARV